MAKIFFLLCVNGECKGKTFGKIECGSTVYFIFTNKI